MVEPWTSFASGTKWIANVTIVTLAYITFVSGYFLGKNKINTKDDIVRFYKKRFLRIYPLFFVSATSLFLVSVIWGGYFTSSIQYILTLCGGMYFC